ncbi:MAG TPA: hypothetical protein VFH77_07970 [Streptomyces sp.]|nr:hypothetical protein [Streptomyces sp.]
MDLDLSHWACLDCGHRFEPPNPDADTVPCPHCAGTATIPVVPVTEIGL